jgi:hypothetical protein
VRLSDGAVGYYVEDVLALIKQMEVRYSNGRAVSLKKRPRRSPLRDRMLFDVSLAVAALTGHGLYKRDELTGEVVPATPADFKRSM